MTSRTTNLIIREVYYEHLSFVVDLLHLSPSEVMCLARALKSKYSAVINAQVQLVPTVILQHHHKVSIPQ